MVEVVLTDLLGGDRQEPLLFHGAVDECWDVVLAVAEVGYPRGASTSFMSWRTTSGSVSGPPSLICSPASSSAT